MHKVLYDVNNAERIFQMILYARAFPGTVVTVQDQQSADKLIRLGMKPSQIRLSSEPNNRVRSFDMMTVEV